MSLCRVMFRGPAIFFSYQRRVIADIIVRDGDVRRTWLTLITFERENTYISIGVNGFVILSKRGGRPTHGKRRGREGEREREALLGTIKLGGLSPRSHLNVRSKGAAYLWLRDKIARAILITHHVEAPRRIVKRRRDVETVRPNGLFSPNSPLPTINDPATGYKLRPRAKSLSRDLANQRRRKEDKTE